MGQTLTHGIYLPDEGERNCYDGLAANWQLLDGAVGTVAEHTSALAGKAPAVHTHTKSDITDFPVYGNAAGTICEGNDSRLSDARTPVAHTHGKADITDLFNSANTWSGGNTFSKTLNIYNSDSSGAVPALYLKSSKSVIGTTSGSETDTQKIAVLDKNGNTVSENTTYVYSAGGSWVVNAVYTTDSSDNVISSQISHYIYKNGLRVLRPETNTDLGTSVKQWNNLYAKRVNTQSVNGVNPGALSLPNFDSDGYVDLSSNLTENVQYEYTPAVDGWLALYAQVNGFHAENAVGIFNADTTLGNDSFRWANTATAAINLERQTRKYFGSVFLPVKAGYRYFCWLRVDQSTTLGQKWLIFYKAKGNV